MTISSFDSIATFYISVQATRCPDATSRNSGTEVLQLSTASGHLG